MIQIYKSGNNDFSHNGDAVIEPISCVLKCELNGIWEIELISTIGYDLITENAVISCDTPNGKNQLFRIYDISKTDNQIVSLAYPIFIDSKDDVFIFDKRPTNKNGQQALDELMQGTKYHGDSDIIVPNTAYYINKNLIEALNSDDNQSFINRWGGECSYNNYTITINNRIGADNGARAEFGYNLIGIKEDINMLTVVTRIVPMAYNGYMLPSNETVDSTLINNYPKVYTKVIKFEDVKLKEDAQEGEASFETLDLLYAELRKRCKNEFEKGIDKPKISYDIDIIDLSRVDEYKYLSNLVKLNLGDTVHCKHRRLGIETDARVVSLTYDCVLNKVENLELGDYEPNYFNDVSATQNAVSEVIDMNNKSVLAEKIYGVMNAMNTQFKYQKDIAHKQDVRAILFEDLDPNSQTFGAMCMGSLGFQISSKRNTTDTDWIWSTFGSGKGFSASLINAGVIQAIDIKGVEITGSRITGNEITNGNNFRVDANGNMTARNASFSGDITGSKINGSTISTTENINVGNNIYLNMNSLDSNKMINAGQGAFLSFLYSDIYKFRTCNLSSANDEGSSFFEASAHNAINQTRMQSSRNSEHSYINVSNSSIIIDSHIGTAVYNRLDVNGDFSVTGTKSRVVKTENYGNCLLNAVESTTAIFEDNGNGLINTEGYCTIFFNEIFLQTINTKCDYFVQLTKKNQGDLWCSEKTENYFIVEGLPGSKFDWNVKAKQRDYETSNLDIAKDYDAQTRINNEAKNQDEMLDRELKESLTSQTTFENEVVTYYESYMREQEVTYE